MQVIEKICPLCGSENIYPYATDKKREYLQCGGCDLVFVPRIFHLSSQQANDEYDLHQNKPEDQGYRNFLNRLCGPMIMYLNPCSRGLDFGSGPGPTLSLMFEEAGHEVELYDIFYAPSRHVFSKQYDFVSASEVVEHLLQPGLELKRLWDCLKPGGVLGVMTKRVENKESFKKWHYKNDLTHICFFSDTTVDWLVENLGAEMVFKGKDVFILRKVSTHQNQ